MDWDTTDDSSLLSLVRGGRPRWMSPGLINPRTFGFWRVRETKSSDCYALGMVIYEIISGHLPFHGLSVIDLPLRVLEGERPPRTASFTDSLWKMLEQCWEAQPDARPSIEEVLWCLEQEEALSPRPYVEMEETGYFTWDLDWWDSSVDSFYSCGKFPHFIPPAKSHGLCPYAGTDTSFVDPQASCSS